MWGSSPDRPYGYSDHPREMHVHDFLCMTDTVCEKLSTHLRVSRISPVCFPPRGPVLLRTTPKTVKLGPPSHDDDPPSSRSRGHPSRGRMSRRWRYLWRNRIPPGGRLLPMLQLLTCSGPHQPLGLRKSRSPPNPATFLTFVGTPGPRSYSVREGLLIEFKTCLRNREVR